MNKIIINVTKVKLWKVTVNNWGWDKPKTLYFTSKREAEQECSKYPAKDNIKYAGCFTPQNAMVKMYGRG